MIPYQNGTLVKLKEFISRDLLRYKTKTLSRPHLSPLVPLEIGDLGIVMGYFHKDDVWWPTTPRDVSCYTICWLRNGEENIVYEDEIEVVKV